MDPIELLLMQLDSIDPVERDEAALALMGLGDPRAVEALLRVIAKPETVHHRGTLVHALGAFDCRDHLEALVELVLTEDFEVASCAFNILEESSHAPSFKQRISAVVGRYEGRALPFEHNESAVQALRELVR